MRKGTEVSITLVMLTTCPSCPSLLSSPDVQEGGETAFPDKSEWVHKEAGAKYDEEFSACAKGHVGIKPKLVSRQPACHALTTVVLHAAAACSCC